LKSFVYFQEKGSPRSPKGMSMQEILFFQVESKREWTYSDIYFMGVDILVKVNGVTCLDVSPSKAQILMTNPVKSFQSNLMESIIYDQTPLKKLCMYGSSISDADQIYGSELETLILYNVDVTKQNAIRLANFSPKLKALSIYKKDKLSIVKLPWSFLKYVLYNVQRGTI
jgi:hypothetical protein